MSRRLIAIAGLAVTLVIVVAVCVVRVADLSSQSQQIYSASGQQGLTQKQQNRASTLGEQASGLEQLITPLSTGSLACGVAILVVFGRRRQLR
jgi:predicted PurR-regulated permease PerM